MNPGIPGRPQPGYIFSHGMFDSAGLRRHSRDRYGQGPPSLFFVSKSCLFPSPPVVPTSHVIRLYNVIIILLDHVVFSFLIFTTL